MAYLMLYGVGWTQRWAIAEGAGPLVATEVNRVGRDEVGRIPIVDPGTGRDTTLVIAWRSVAAAVVLGADTEGSGVTDQKMYP